MGLDMYLEKRTYVKNWDHQEEKDHNKVTITKNGKERKDIDPKKITYIIEELGYWRKANAIHSFFIKNLKNRIDDYKELNVDKVTLEDLLDKCDRILKSSTLIDGKIINGQKLKDGKWVNIMEKVKKIKDPSIARKLLPPKDGFFFGNKQYDEYYLDNIKYTKKICLEAIKAIENGSEIYYQASW